MDKLTNEEAQAYLEGSIRYSATNHEFFMVYIGESIDNGTFVMIRDGLGGNYLKDRQSPI
jgi:hypothetical protein